MFKYKVQSYFQSQFDRILNKNSKIYKTMQVEVVSIDFYIFLNKKPIYKFQKVRKVGVED